MRKATNISRKQLLHLGICIGKFTHSNKFHLVITALDVLAPYAKVLLGIHTHSLISVCVWYDNIVLLSIVQDMAEA